MSDDVQLADLEVISRYSLAVRAASAPRAELVAALEADLAWLSRGRPRSAGRPGGAAAPDDRSGSAARAPARRAPRRGPAQR